MAVITKTKDTRVVRRWRKRAPCILLIECKLLQPLWKAEWKFLKKLKLELSYNPAIPLLGIPRGNEISI
jgi:hypothetical protein